MEQKRISYRKLPYTSQENVALYTTNQKFGLIIIIIILHDQNCIIIT